MEQFVNYASLSLAASCGAGDATISVSNGTVLPALGTFRLQVDNEILVATARTGAVVSVLRGQEGTTAAAHALGAQVKAIVTAGAMKQLLLDNRAYTALSFTSLYADPENVSGLAADTNDGSSGAPLLTTAEVQQRLYLGALTGDTTVQYLSDDPVGGLDYSTVYLGNYNLVFKGTPQVLHTGGTMDTGTVAINSTAAGGGQDQTVHTSDLSSFTPYVIGTFGGGAPQPTRIVDTTGGNAGNGAWIVQTPVSVATASCSNPCDAGSDATGPFTSGDSYKIVRGSKLSVANITAPVTGSGPGGANGLVFFEDFAFTDAHWGAEGAVYERCSFDGPLVVGGTFTDCFVNHIVQVQAEGPVALVAGVLVCDGNDSLVGLLSMTGDLYVAGPLFLGRIFFSSVWIYGGDFGLGIQVHNTLTTDAGVIVVDDFQLTNSVGSSPTLPFIWGAGSVGLGLIVGSGAALQCALATGHRMSVRGAGGHFGFIDQAGFIQVARALDPSTGELTELGSTATRATTWDNFYAAIGSGGFNGRCHYPETRAAVIAY